MRRFVVFGFILISCIKAQNHRIQRPFDDGHGWDIRLAVPGEPGSDYPVLNSIPRTSFTCSGKEPGYYADTETNCQVFRVCTLGTTYGFQSFLCPNGTLFNQAVFVCDWWMQVNCQKSLELININNEKFGNLKLGPQFMSDIKKMITHPMRNPYDKVFSKNNIVMMQEYKPPSGQLYSGNFNRNSQHSENLYNPNTSQYNQENAFRDIFSNSDISFAASTPTNQFIRHRNTFNSQKQTFPYSQLNKAQTLPNTNFALISNAHGGQSSQNNKQYTTFNRSPNISSINSQFYNNRNSNTVKQTIYTLDYSKQQLNQHINQEKQLYTPGPTQARFSKDITSHVDKETKQNLDLVFSLLADSINTAKEYNTVAQQSISKHTPSQLQQYELRRISKDTSKSTSSQYPRPSPSYLETKAEQTSKPQTGNINYLSRYTQQQSQRLQSTPHNIIPTQNKGKLHTNEYIKNSNSDLPATITNPNKIYSGQLYQLPVPDVTKQIYNLPKPSISNFILSNSFLPKYSPQPNSEAEVEIIPSQIIPTPSLQSSFNEKDKEIDQGRNANVFIDDFQIPTNGISAQISDNIVGTIPHPEDNDKLIQYKKDQSYYFYSHLNNNNNDDLNNKINLPNKLFLLSNVSDPTFQLIPSVGYKLDNEKEKQKLLNVFQIDEYGNPKKSKQNENININRPQDISSDVDFAVIHPTSVTKSQKFSNFNVLYNGPTSYSAPQASIGSLETKQNIIKDSYLNSRLEKFDDFDKDYGYPKIIPAKKFTF